MLCCTSAQMLLAGDMIWRCMLVASKVIVKIHARSHPDPFYSDTYFVVAAQVVQ